MAVQSWIRVLILCLTAFDSSEAATRYPETASNGKYIDRKLWRAPSKPSDTPICDAEAVKLNFPQVHQSCKTECLALSKRADLIFSMLRDTKPAAKTVSRQCSGFLDGHCRSLLLGAFTTCWCHAKNFNQMSSVCRNLILEWYRDFINARTRAGEYYNSSVKPKLSELIRFDSATGGSFLGNLKSKASGIWGNYVRPRLPGRRNGGGMVMDDMMLDDLMMDDMQYGMQMQGTPKYGQRYDYGHGQSQSYFAPGRPTSDLWSSGSGIFGGLRGGHAPNLNPPDGQTEEELYDKLLELLETDGLDSESRISHDRRG